MAPREERSVKQQEIIPAAQGAGRPFPGARAFAAPYPMVQGQRGEPLQFVLAGENLQEVGRSDARAAAALAPSPASAASTPTCSSTCRSSSSSPTARASPPPS
jgi:HAE1 family hydrophobic/amphiphilic exporter-1